MSSTYQTIVVGGGPAGVGIGVALLHLGVENFTIIDRYDVGASFDRWPREMRLITPSFATNSIGMLDLNSVAIGTSPAHSLQCEHPTGRHYAAYLRAVAQHFKLPIRTGVDVESLGMADDGTFELRTNRGMLRAPNVVWAAGEFQYPRTAAFDGAELCLHNSQVASWNDLEGDDFLVIGGYESGADAAVQLAARGKRVRVIDRHGRWSDDSSDPSCSLSPFTRQRVVEARKMGEIEFTEGAEVAAVTKGKSEYRIEATNGSGWRSRTQPILAVGFSPSANRIGEWFEWRDDGYPKLDEHDQSTIAPGLFLAGPSVRQDLHVFCFIYKFRQRFAVVARAIGKRLEIDTSPLEQYRAWGMFLDDLSCCGQECAC